MHPFKIQLQIQGVDIGKKFDELSEDALTSNEVYEQFVNWMLISYRSVKGKNRGKLLNVSCVRNYLGSIIRQAYDKLLPSKRKETGLFFQCLDKFSVSQQAKWLQGEHIIFNVKTLQ